MKIVTKVYRGNADDEPVLQMTNYEFSAAKKAMEKMERTYKRTYKD